MDLEELSLRLGSLEQARASDMQKAAQQAFMDKYGSRISNNGDLGLIILNELNRRNIDTSAADEAVQQILDQLRMEATMLLDTIKQDMNQAAELVDKIDFMDESIQAAAMATGTDLSPESGEMPPEMPATEEQMAVENGEVPPEGMSAEGGVPAEETTASSAPEEVPPEEVPPEPTPEEAMPPEEQLPNQTVSDMRMKRIKQLVSDRRAKHVKKNVSVQPAGSKLDSDILSVCMGGF